MSLKTLNSRLKHLPHQFSKQLRLNQMDYDPRGRHVECPPRILSRSGAAHMQLLLRKYMKIPHSDQMTASSSPQVPQLFKWFSYSTKCKNTIMSQQLPHRVKQPHFFRTKKNPRNWDEILLAFSAPSGGIFGPAKHGSSRLELFSKYSL